MSACENPLRRAFKTVSSRATNARKRGCWEIVFTKAYYHTIAEYCVFRERISDFRAQLVKRGRLTDTRYSTLLPFAVNRSSGQGKFATDYSRPRTSTIQQADPAWTAYRLIWQKILIATMDLEEGVSDPQTSGKTRRIARTTQLYH